MSEPTSNRLKDSTSPYLRSAAHQPVDWHEWGEEAFGKARTECKPILLDIGAVWCHWCHVIDRESYENPEIAEIINRHYVPVKVDRDERPEVDARYQSAISVLSGQGGWPLTAFLTPEGMPFFGGTYFPPDDAMGRPGMRRILLTIAEAFENRRAELDQSAQALQEAVRQAESYRGAQAPLDAQELLKGILEPITRLFDAKNGGFGQAPKFPHASAIELLLEVCQPTADSNLIQIADLTLEKMALGGVYDQLGGGFHRYSVDERWCVPHFEKMTYDNSELLKNYLHAYQVACSSRTREPDKDGMAQLFRETAQGIIGWVEEVLSDRERGGFYASQDADQTLHDDGDYFTWTLEELRAALSPEEARAMASYYDVASRGEMHHNPTKNVLWVTASLEDLAKQLRLDETSTRLLVARAKGKLLAARRRRQPTPAVDTTVYVGWNAMFVSTFLEAARVLARDDCRSFALKTLDRILAQAWDDSKGFSHRVGGPPIEGGLDDQVFTAGALLDAYEETLERRYFDGAVRAMKLTIERFGDAEQGGFFDRAKDAAPIGGLDVRRKPLQDSPTPAANPIAAIVLDRLYAYTGGREYRDWAQRTLEAFAGLVPQYGLFAATYGLAAVLHWRHPIQVVVTGAKGDARAAALEAAAARVYRLGKAVLRVTPERMALDSLTPALRETLPHLDAAVPQAFVCVETTCHPPTTDPEELASLLVKLAPASVASASD